MVFQKVDLPVYVFFIKRGFPTISFYVYNSNTVTHMSYSYKGHMEREVAIYSEKNKNKNKTLLRDIDYLHTLKMIDEKKSWLGSFCKINNCILIYIIFISNIFLFLTWTPVVTGKIAGIKAYCFLFSSLSYPSGKRTRFPEVHLWHRAYHGGVSTQSCFQISKYLFRALARGHPLKHCRALSTIFPIIEHKENDGGIIRVIERHLDFQETQLLAEEWASSGLSAPAPPSCPQNQGVSISGFQVERDHSGRGEILSCTGL